MKMKARWSSRQDRDATRPVPQGVKQRSSHLDIRTCKLTYFYGRRLGSSQKVKKLSNTIMIVMTENDDAGLVAG